VSRTRHTRHHFGLGGGGAGGIFFINSSIDSSVGASAVVVLFADVVVCQNESLTKLT
jgi:hypothetical protein